MRSPGDVRLEWVGNTSSGPQNVQTAATGRSRSAGPSTAPRPRDLVGKKIGMNTLGGHAQAVLDLYLRRNGLGADDVATVEALAVPPRPAGAPVHPLAHRYSLTSSTGREDVFWAQLTRAPPGGEAAT